MGISYDDEGLPRHVVRGLANKLGAAPVLLVPRRLRNPTWHYEGMLYSAIPHPTYPVDPSLVAAIRESDPDFIPLWVTYLFRPPPDTHGLMQPVVKFVRHAISRHIPSPRTAKPTYIVAMPLDARFPVPNQIDRILGGCKSKTLPEPYEPLTWDSYHRPWRQGTAREVEEQFINAPIVAAEREGEYRRREWAGARAELDAYVDKKWDSVSTPEINQALERQRLGIPLNMPDAEANELRDKILKYRSARRAAMRRTMRSAYMHASGIAAIQRVASPPFNRKVGH